MTVSVLDETLGLKAMLTDLTPVTLYISKPDKDNVRTKARESTAVLFLTDVFGLDLPENKLFVISLSCE